jgi:hypothetical protein
MALLREVLLEQGRNAKPEASTNSDDKDSGK